jgi:hypothetical protein
LPNVAQCRCDLRRLLDPEFIRWKYIDEDKFSNGCCHKRCNWNVCLECLFVLNFFMLKLVIFFMLKTWNGEKLYSRSGNVKKQGKNTCFIKKAIYMARNGGQEAVRRAGSCSLDNSVHYTDQWFSLANTKCPKWLFIFTSIAQWFLPRTK